MYLRTDLGTETLHAGNENVGGKKPAHRLTAVDRKLTAVEILVNINRIPISQSHDVVFGVGDRVAVIVVAPRVPRGDGRAMLLRRGFGGGLNSLRSRRSLSRKHKVQ